MAHQNSKASNVCGNVSTFQLNGQTVNQPIPKFRPAMGPADHTTSSFLQHPIFERIATVVNHKNTTLRRDNYRFHAVEEWRIIQCFYPLLRTADVFNVKFFKCHDTLVIH